VFGILLVSISLRLSEISDLKSEILPENQNALFSCPNIDKKNRARIGTLSASYVLTRNIRTGDWFGKGLLTSRPWLVSLWS
jgi:hypothetical protein